MAKQKQQKDYLYLAYKGKEYLWLGFSILSILISIYCLIKSDREQAMYFIGLTFLAGVMYSFNRYRRKKMEQREREKENFEKGNLKN